MQEVETVYICEKCGHEIMAGKRVPVKCPKCDGKMSTVTVVRR